MGIGRCRIGYCVITIGAASTHAHAETLSAFWVGPPFGNWSEPSNWLPPTVPSNTSTTDFIPLVDLFALQSSVVTVDAPFAVRSIFIQPSDTVRVKDGRFLVLTAGVVQNDGTLAIDGEEDATELVLIESGSLSGQGTIVLEGTGFARLRATSNAVPLFNDSQHEIRGIGSIIVGASGLLNAGTISADIGVGTTGSLLIAGGAGGTVVNAGEMLAIKGPMHIAGSAFANAGLLSIAVGRTLTCDGPWTQFFGTTTIDGVAEPFEALVAMHGTIQGRGLIDGTLRCDAASVEPGNVGSIGTLTVGQFETGAGTTIRVDITNGGSDRLHVLGDALFAGGVIEIVRDDTAALIGQTYLVIAIDGTTSGTLPTVESCPPATLIVTEEGLAITFPMLGAPLGDLDLDGEVTASDLAILMGAWGSCESACCAADVDGDGTIDALDLATLLADWGAAPQP